MHGKGYFCKRSPDEVKAFWDGEYMTKQATLIICFTLYISELRCGISVFICEKRIINGMMIRKT